MTEKLSRILNNFIIKLLNARYIFLESWIILFNLLILGCSLFACADGFSSLDRVVFKIEMRQWKTSLKIVQLIQIFDIVPFKIKNLQIIQETNVEKFRHFVVSNVKFFKLFESLDTLYFSQFTPSNIENPYIFERCTYISKTRYYGIIKFQHFQTFKDFSCDL